MHLLSHIPEKEHELLPSHALKARTERADKKGENGNFTKAFTLPYRKTSLGREGVV
jgi:hypothetical protein